MTVRHGTITGYATDKCRCGPCSMAQFRYDKRKAARRRSGPLIVPAIGAIRRIHALQAMGWPLAEISARVGVTNLHCLLGSGRPGITAGKHHRICAVYDDLSMTPGPSTSAAIRAKSKGYAPPLAWDEEAIDNPCAEPLLGQAVRVSFLDIYNELKGIGLSNSLIARRLGIQTRSLESKLRRARLQWSEESA